MYRNTRFALFASRLSTSSFRLDRAEVISIKHLNEITRAYTLTFLQSTSLDKLLKLRKQCEPFIYGHDADKMIKPSNFAKEGRSLTRTQTKPQ